MSVDLAYIAAIVVGIAIGCALMTVAGWVVGG